MNKLNNHRQLKIGEVIREGDFYINKRTGACQPVKFSIGREVDSRQYSDYTFWRRRHTKKPITSNTKMKVATPTKRIPVTNGDKAVKNVAIVKFGYPSRDGYTYSRTVQVIGMDDDYLWGLEMTKEKVDSPKYKYQFKKYLRHKMTTGIILKSYGPAE